MMEYTSVMNWDRVYPGNELGYGMWRKCIRLGYTSTM